MKIASARGEVASFDSQNPTALGLPQPPTLQSRMVGSSLLVWLEGVPSAAAAWSQLRPPLGPRGSQGLWPVIIIAPILPWWPGPGLPPAFDGLE